VPPNVNFLVPPNARAASLADTIVPGSLNIRSEESSAEQDAG
jgi:hypothetical protein